MAWLIARMPCGDRDTMHLDLLRENVAYACRAREEFPWTKALPDSVFRNEVLPYAVVDEVRDGAPGYYEVVKHPMWVKKIMEKLSGAEKQLMREDGVLFDE